MIGNAETSHNRTSSIVLGFKEALLEEAEKKKEKKRYICNSHLKHILRDLSLYWVISASATMQCSDNKWFIFKAFRIGSSINKIQTER